MNYFKLMQAAIAVAQRIAGAKLPESDGGTDVTPVEAIGVGLEVSNKFCDMQGDELTVSIDDLRQCAINAGFTVTE